MPLMRPLFSYTPNFKLSTLSEIYSPEVNAFASLSSPTPPIGSGRNDKRAQIKKGVCRSACAHQPVKGTPTLCI